MSKDNPYEPPSVTFEPTKTLRDEFAMAALTGLAGDDGARTQAADEIHENDARAAQTVSDVLADWAYHCADAMLKAREVKP